MRRVLLALFSSIALLLTWQEQVFATEPLISTSKFQDGAPGGTPNGTVERIRWEMNGTVTTCVYEAGDWTVNTAGSINVVITGLTCTGLDNFLDITVSADANETSSSTLPVISYSNADLDNSFVVSTGTPTAFASVTADDGAAPVISTISFRDDGVDAYMDTLRFTFSEPVADASVMSENDITVTNDGDFNGYQFSTSPTDTLIGTLSFVDIYPSDFNVSSVKDTFDNSGAFAVSTRNTFSLVDAAGNINALLGAQTQATYVDTMAPRILDATYQDGDGDGKIDRVLLSFTETVTAASILAAENLTFSTIGDFTGAAFGSNGTDLITGSVSSITVPFGTEATAVVTTAGGGAYLDAIDGVGSFLLTDGTNSITATSSLLETPQDGSNPVIVSVTPASAATGVTTSTSVTLTFSEAMTPGFAYATEFTTSPNPGTWGAPVWTNSDKTATLSHAAFSCNTAYTITTAEATIDSSGGTLTTLLTTGPEDGDWSFTTAACASGSSGYISPTKTYTIDLTAPTGSENTLTAYDPISIAWTTGGTGTVAGIDLYYAVNGGTTWTLFADNTANDGSYDWTVPALTNGGTLVIKAEATDLVAVLASDTSPEVSIYVQAIPVPIITEVPPAVAPVANGLGLSPVTGLPEQISQVSVGQYIRSISLPTVYYLDPNGTRRPFLSEQVYFTWATSFNQVITVTDATLPTIPVGTPVIPRPRVVLVKIASSTKVYAVEPADATSTKGILRWIPTESIATSVYGADWADYVIDIPSTIISRYTYGEDLTASDTRPAGMKKRSTLHN